MTRLAEIQGHVANMGELLDIVGAMRSLAGMRIQESQHALPGIRSYADAMAAAIGNALLFMPRSATDASKTRGRRALILCTAEHGFVGAFNEKMLEAANAALQSSDLLFVLGSRGAALWCEHGLKVAWSQPMATRPAGVPDAVDRLTNQLYARIARSEIDRVEVIFNRYCQGAASTIERRLLLPLDTAALGPMQSRQAPLHNLPPRPLLERLMAEYVFALLTEAVVESIASENAARFATMESAHDNVTKKLARLRENARQVRQTEITSELLDLMTGTEAMLTGSTCAARKSKPL